MNFKTGDKVVVISGKSKGKEGKITKVLRRYKNILTPNLTPFECLTK